MSLEPQEPAGAPEFAPHVAQALEGSGAALVGLLAPWVAMVQARDETLGLAIPTLLELQASHAALLEYIERRGIRPSFAHDVRTLEQAHALAERLNAEDRT